ncbi:MAG TPA: ABC transporter permease, partial [Acidimicrobiales bacterium]|nr:ABC transporter permease [Acidimicrobiales bacterium]
PTPARMIRVGTWVLGTLAFYVFVATVFDAGAGTFFTGMVVGGTIYGLVGVGIVLTYRTNRIINFAAAGIGAVPGITMSLLVAQKGWSWWLAFPLAIIGGAVLGGLADIIVIRRFATAPRLILTVATIGIGQILAYASLRIGLALGTKGRPPQLQSPFSNKTFSIEYFVFTYDFPVAIVVVVVAVAALTLFLRYTRVGIAMRAASENSDRASLLGIPVRRVQTTTWVVAGALASTCIFLRSTLVGVPADGNLGFKVFLLALAAAVLAKMESVPRCLVAGMGIGIVASATLSKTGKDSLTTAIMLVVLLVALLIQRKSLSRAQDTGASTWQTVKEFRPIPSELRALPEVVGAKIALWVVMVPGFFFLFSRFAGHSRIGFAQSVIISAIVAVSLVVLTGWAGQISLGQYGFVGVGAIVAGKLVVDHHADFFLATAAAVIAGALVAVLIGLPALRIQGLFLAVTTMAFGGAMQYFFLDRSYRIPQLILPARADQVRAPVLWGRLALTDPFGLPDERFYAMCVAFLGLAALLAHSYRKNRAGRALVAVRENSRAASAYSVNTPRTRLGAFAVSGGMAALAGALLVHQSGAVDSSTYGIDRSIAIFVIVVIGGLTSIPGAIVGAILLESVRFFGTESMQLLVTGPGLLLVLLLLPGGLAEAMYAGRDLALRWVARRHDIDVPSLTADRRAVAGDERGVIEGAEERVESSDAFDVLHERRVTCPVCGESLAVDDAPDHEHLRAPATIGALR